MHGKEQFRSWHTISRTPTVTLAIAIVLALTVIMAQSAQAQTFTVLHNFTGEQDGESPYAGLTLDEEEISTEQP